MDFLQIPNYKMISNYDIAQHGLHLDSLSFSLFNEGEFNQPFVCSSLEVFLILCLILFPIFHLRLSKY